METDISALSAYARAAMGSRSLGIAIDDLLSIAQKALVPVRGVHGGANWQLAPPFFRPAPDNSGRWDVCLGLIWDMEGAGERALRVALGAELGSVLTTAFEDFRFWHRPEEFAEAAGLEYEVEAFLYTGSDLIAAESLSGRIFVMIDRDNRVLVADDIRIATDIPEGHAMRWGPPDSLWDGLVGFKTTDEPPAQYARVLTSIACFGLLRLTEHEKFPNRHP